MLASAAPLTWTGSRDNTDPDTAGGWFLRLLAWPAWSFDSDDSVREVIAARHAGDPGGRPGRAVPRCLLPGTQLARARGTISQFFAGWSAYVFAGAFAGFIAALPAARPDLLGAFQAAGDGAGYGLFTGWIIGITTLGGYAGPSLTHDVRSTVRPSAPQARPHGRVERGRRASDASWQAISPSARGPAGGRGHHGRSPVAR